LASRRQSSTNIHGCSLPARTAAQALLTTPKRSRSGSRPIAAQSARDHPGDGARGSSRPRRRSRRRKSGTPRRRPSGSVASRVRQHRALLGERTARLASDVDAHRDAPQRRASPLRSSVHRVFLLAQVHRRRLAPRALDARVDHRDADLIGEAAHHAGHVAPAAGLGERRVQILGGGVAPFVALQVTAQAGAETCPAPATPPTIASTARPFA
jgi:hypothetical protein